MDTQAFFSYMNAALTPYHAARASQALLTDAGFAPLAWADDWQLAPGRRYSIDIADGMTVAFALPKVAPRGFRIACSHNDSPALRLKPQPELVREDCTMLNLEVYGGPILTTWFDRPLAIAGRVYSRGSDWAHPTEHLVQLPECVTIPSLAVHMKRGEGAIEPQKELLALWGDAHAPTIKRRLAETLGLQEDDILASELYLVSAEKAAVVGVGDTLYAASRIDNLANAYAATLAIADAAPRDHIVCFVSYQHEEIGSHSRQGAAGSRLRQTLARIAKATAADLDALLAESLILSCDQAHAAHPNYPEKADPVLRPHLGAGPVLKLAANYSYATTPRGEAMLRALAADIDIPLQVFANRAGSRGGSTIGPIAEVATGIETIDLGSPMLAMHSIRELADLRDQTALQTLMCAFFEH